MDLIVRWSRLQTPRIVAVVLLVTAFLVGQLPTVSADDVRDLAARYQFTPLTIAMPPNLTTQSIRAVNQDYDRIPAWVSSVGAGIAMNDLTGDGLANDLCLTDPRYDEAIVTPVPEEGPARYQPFVLDPAALPMDHTMAPMGCVPGDFNDDQRMDLLVYYWGRTPVVFLGRESDNFSAAAFHPVEMIAGVSAGGEYHGPQWNTNAVAVADFDGDGHEDVFVGNYWPHSPVLDHTVDGGVEMPDSLSYALNGGESYIYRWTGGSGGAEPTVSYELAEGALPGETPDGWVLAAAAADLDGNQLPELYIAHDFGRDRLLHNRSEAGQLRFGVVEGDRVAMTPKSKVLGRGSFKGMGVDMADLSGDGMYDIVVSNITTSYGIQESNYAFVGTADDQTQLAEQMGEGSAPFEDRSSQLGLAWSGWGWDVKLPDLDNDGVVEMVQTTGFVKGQVNRWPQLQEMASSNDYVVSNPQAWPHIRAGDDVAGSQVLAFFAQSPSGRYVNLTHELGLAEPIPTRGIATGDADGDGRLDFAVARQWDEPVFYRNDSPETGEFLGLRLRHAPTLEADDAAVPGSPVVGAQVEVTTPDGRTLLGRVDGGSGHAGKRSHEVHVGLGEVSGPVSVTIAWRDRDGTPREQTMRLAPGWHSLQLGEQAQEVRS